MTISYTEITKPTNPSLTEITAPSFPSLEWDDLASFWDEVDLSWDASGYTDIDRANFLFFQPEYPLNVAYPFQDYVSITKPT